MRQKLVDPGGLLMIEPTGRAAAEPLIDTVTRKMTVAWRHRADAREGYRGYHRCICGAISDNRDHWTEGWLTNSLCIHYCAFHREDIPADEVAKVLALPYGEALPWPSELCASVREKR